MFTFLIIFLIALTITAASIPWVRRFALRVGFVDAPASRKLHKDPVPLLGGVAIFAGAILAVFLFADGLPASVVGVMLSMSLMVFIGVVDDWRGLPAWVKLAGQAVGTAVLIYFGIYVRLPIPDAINYAITLLWVVGMSNAINFLDNMDGLSAGVCGVACSFILLLGMQNGQFLVSALAAATFGACLGFLRYNFKPATIFMGDAGSLFLGYVLALLCLQLRFPQNVTFVTWMIPVFILGVPIFDMTLVVVSRLRRGVSPNTPGKDHLSHRLVEFGFSQREAVLVLYLLAGVSGMVALYLTEASLLEGYFVLATAVILGLVAIWQLDNKRNQLQKLEKQEDVKE
jgi:UDP-GlcNAc:undecaprenyl-phosphate GlcNAc-1-phosphate transferase